MSYWNTYLSSRSIFCWDGDEKLHWCTVLLCSFTLASFIFAQWYTVSTMIEVSCVYTDILKQINQTSQKVDIIFSKSSSALSHGASQHICIVLECIVIPITNLLNHLHYSHKYRKLLHKHSWHLSFPIWSFFFGNFGLYFLF